MKCKIRDLELTTDLSAFDDEHVSAALGYICHLTIMLSKFFQVWEFFKPLGQTTFKLRVVA